MPSLTGRRRRELGDEHERLVASCFDAPWVEPPSWLFCVRRARPDEDASGIDVVVDTDVGEIGIQVKSSRRFLSRHEKRYPGVPVLIVQAGESEARVRKRVLGLLKRVRRRRKQPSGVDSKPMSETLLCLGCNASPATSTGPIPLCEACEALAKEKSRGVEFMTPQEREDSKQISQEAYVATVVKRMTSEP